MKGKTEQAINKFIKTVVSSKIPPDFENIFLISKTQFIRIFNGSLMASSWSEYGMLTSITAPDRGRLLDNFAKFEFFLNQLIALKIVEFGHWNRNRLDDVINEVNFFNKIKLLKSWRIISKSLQKRILEVNNVRNQLAHKFEMYEITYLKKPLQLSYSRPKRLENFKKFKTDMEKIWKEVTEIYQTEQNKIDIENLIQKIQDYNKKTV